MSVPAITGAYIVPDHMESQFSSLPPPFSGAIEESIYPQHLVTIPREVSQIWTKTKVTFVNDLDPEGEFGYTCKANLGSPEYALSSPVLIGPEHTAQFLHNCNVTLSIRYVGNVPEVGRRELFGKVGFASISEQHELARHQYNPTIGTEYRVLLSQCLPIQTEKNFTADMDGCKTM